MIINSLSVGAVGAPATLGTSVPTNQEKWWHAYRLLEKYSLKEGAI
jgi:hypothetical protein